MLHSSSANLNRRECRVPLTTQHPWGGGVIRFWVARDVSGPVGTLVVARSNRGPLHRPHPWRSRRGCQGRKLGRVFTADVHCPAARLPSPCAHPCAQCDSLDLRVVYSICKPQPLVACEGHRGSWTVFQSNSRSRRRAGALLRTW